MIIDTLNKYSAWDMVQKFGEGYKNKYSYEGFCALFDYMEDYSEEMEENVEFDFIAWCCDFTEYKNLEEIKKDYKMIDTMEDLENFTQVIEFDGGIIIQNF